MQCKSTILCQHNEKKKEIWNFLEYFLEYSTLERLRAFTYCTMSCNLLCHDVGELNINSKILQQTGDKNVAHTSY